jgi:hypothetical protein
MTVFGTYHGVDVIKALEDFNTGGGGCAPHLDDVCPDRFDGYFINKQLIA